MNPYKQLSKVANVNSSFATLSKRDGTALTLSVKAEEVTDERIESNYSGSMRVRVWSADVRSFLKDDGTTAYPAEGDRLVLNCADGRRRAFLTTRDAASSRYWDWKYGMPGYRIVFYTKTEGLEVD